jgi:hypothetical protein
VKAARNGKPGRHRGPRLLRTVSDSLADQCPLPDTEPSLIRLQAAARDRGFLGEDVALSGLTAAPAGKQPEPTYAGLGATVILADPPHSSRRRQRQRARPLVALAVPATAVAVIIVLAALLGPLGQHRTVTLVHNPPIASARPYSILSPCPCRPAAPIRFAGTWTGQVSQKVPPSGSFTVSVQLTVHPRSTRVQISYSGPFTCSDYLLPVSASSDQLVLSQGMISGPCTSGTVTLTAQADQSLKFRYAFGDVSATGTLTRKKR